MTEERTLNRFLVSDEGILYRDPFRRIVRASSELRFTISGRKKLAALAVRLGVYGRDMPPIFAVDAGYQFGLICVFVRLHNARYSGCTAGAQQRGNVVGALAPGD